MTAHKIKREPDYTKGYIVQAVGRRKREFLSRSATDGCACYGGVCNWGVMELPFEFANRSVHEARLGQGLGRADAAESETGPYAYNFPIVITDMPINATQRKIALSVVILLLAIGVITAPFAGLPAPRVDSFIPVLQAVLCLVELITAALLFSQFSVRPRYAVLAIASGYLFSGLFAFAQTLAFPGAYSATGLIGGGSTAGWLFVLWHTAFPLAAIIYALSKTQNDLPSETYGSSSITLVATIAAVIIATAAMTFMVAKFPALLPPLYDNATKQTGWATVADIYLSALTLATLAVLFIHRRTILDLWLMVTLFAWLPNFLTASCFTLVRFSIGWYISRCFSVVASSALLVVLLSEMTVIYARLANSILLLRRERTDRLASVEAATAAIAHEIRQPMTGINSLGAAGLRWLDRKPSDIEKAKSCFNSILGAVRRSEEIISSIRELFKKAPSHRTMIQLNNVIRLVLQLAQHDLLSSGTSVTTEYQEGLPLIYADHTQLQQVILNLVKNAMDAMRDRPLGERRLRIATGSDRRSTVSFYIHDSGTGVAREDRERIFNPFFTTKSTGMGLGLSICRTIIEEHGGTLRLTKSGPAGSTFEIAMPIAAFALAADATQAAAPRDRPAPPLVPAQ